MSRKKCSNGKLVKFGYRSHDDAGVHPRLTRGRCVVVKMPYVVGEGRRASRAIRRRASESSARQNGLAKTWAAPARSKSSLVYLPVWPDMKQDRTCGLIPWRAARVRGPSRGGICTSRSTRAMVA